MNHERPLPLNARHIDGLKRGFLRADGTEFVDQLFHSLVTANAGTRERAGSQFVRSALLDSTHELRGFFRDEAGDRDDDPAHVQFLSVHICILVFSGAGFRPVGSEDFPSTRVE